MPAGNPSPLASGRNRRTLDASYAALRDHKARRHHGARSDRRTRDDGLSAQRAVEALLADKPVLDFRIFSHLSGDTLAGDLAAILERLVVAGYTAYAIDLGQPNTGLSARRPGEPGLRPSQSRNGPAKSSKRLARDAPFTVLPTDRRHCKIRHRGDE